MLSLPGAIAASLLASATLKIAAPNLQAVGVDEKKVQTFTDYFAQQLAQWGFRVTTSSEISAVLGVERQRQLLGCTTDLSACMAELSGALGADAVIVGNVARLEPKGYLLTLKIVAARDGSSMGSWSTRVASEDEAVDWLAGVARQFAASQGVAEGTHFRRYAWIPAVAGVAVGAVGTALFVASTSTANQLRTGQGTTPTQLNGTVSSASAQQSAGVACIVVGAVGLAAGVTLFIAGDRGGPVGVAIIPQAGGVAAALSGSF